MPGSRPQDYPSGPYRSCHVRPGRTVPQRRGGMALDHGRARGPPRRRSLHRQSGPHCAALRAGRRGEVPGHALPPAPHRPRACPHPAHLGRAPIAPNPAYAGERCDWRLWREALGRLEWPLRVKGIVAGMSGLRRNIFLDSLQPWRVEPSVNGRAMPGDSLLLSSLPSAGRRRPAAAALFLPRRMPAMAFAIRNLSVLAYANGFTLWHYKAGKDRLDDVAARNFFAEAVGRCGHRRPGDGLGRRWRAHPGHGAGPGRRRGDRSLA